MSADIITLRPITAPRAVDVACAAIAKAFNEAAEKDLFKRRVRSFIRYGTGHPAVRARYGRRAAMLHGYSLPGAIHVTESWYRQEQADFRWANHYGIPHGRLSLEVLRELRLMLRLLRRTPERDHLTGILGFLLDDHPLTIDAETENEAVA